MKWDRLGAFFLAFLIWAGVYLPALGTPELTDAEGRRVLPALTMMETGNWIVPYVGGEAYARKPPMINWIVAASFALTGQQNEQSARLCSALSVLAFVCLLIWLPGTWLSPTARLLSAVIFLTNFGLIEKGRTIEIEAFYTSLTSMAILWWLNGWARDGSRWALWIVPSLFLAAGMLTKGPLILLFYYVTVISVLAYAKRMRALASLPHFVAAAVCLGLPLAWAYLASRQDEGSQVTTQISRDMMERILLGDFAWLQWGKCVLGSLGKFMPWLLLVPALWKREFVALLSESELAVFKGGRLGLCLSFAATALMPGTKARYVVPVIGLASALLGWLLSKVSTLTDGGYRWRTLVTGGFLVSSLGSLGGIILVNRGIPALVLAVSTLCLTVIVFQERERLRTVLPLSLVSGVLIVTLTLQYTLFVLPHAARGETCRAAAAKINALLPNRAVLYVFKPGTRAVYQNLLFYVRPPVAYITPSHPLDARVQYLLIRGTDRDVLADAAEIAARAPLSLYIFTQGRKNEFRLLKLSVPANGREVQSVPVPEPRRE